MNTVIAVIAAVGVSSIIGTFVFLALLYGAKKRDQAELAAWQEHERDVDFMDLQIRD